jgi:hypothetical protein
LNFLGRPLVGTCMKRAAGGQKKNGTFGTPYSSVLGRRRKAMKTKQMRLFPIKKRSHDVDAGKHTVTETEVKDLPCIHCGKRHRKAETAQKCEARAKAKAEREARPKCPHCGRVHRTEAARQKCEAKAAKPKARVCRVCGKKHRTEAKFAECLDKERAHKEAVERADRVFEIAAQL